MNINGGTIGSDVEDEHSGNVFGGSMGRLAKIDGSPFDDPNHWALLATAKTTEVNVTGGIIKRNVYGGGEMGTVIEKATVNISGGTIGKAGSDNVEIGNVFGGGKGYLDPAQTYVGAGIVKGNTNVTIKNGASGGTTTTPTIYQNVYGGGELIICITTPELIEDLTPVKTKVKHKYTVDENSEEDIQENYLIPKDRFYIYKIYPYQLLSKPEKR